MQRANAEANAQAEAEKEQLDTVIAETEAATEVSEANVSTIDPAPTTEPDVTVPAAAESEQSEPAVVEPDVTEPAAAATTAVAEPSEQIETGTAPT